MSKASLSEKLNAVPNVVIDEGTFKYIQIRIRKGDQEKIIIRGSNDAAYHVEVLEEYEPRLKALGFSVDCIGGGRILHDPVKKVLNVYGYSVGFGRADHKITVAKLKELHPDYNISWSDEGY